MTDTDAALKTLQILYRAREKDLDDAYATIRALEAKGERPLETQVELDRVYNEAREAAVRDAQAEVRDVVAGYESRVKNLEEALDRCAEALKIRRRLPGFVRRWLEGA